MLISITGYRNFIYSYTYKKEHVIFIESSYMLYL